MTWLVDADTVEPLVFQQLTVNESLTDGTSSVINVNGQFYRVHVFTSDGLFVVDNPGNAEILCVGGGGGGGAGFFVGSPGSKVIVPASTGETGTTRAVGRAGGGGGGGVVNTTSFLGLNPLQQACYAITVGDGATPAQDAGEDSKVSFVTSAGPGDPFPTDYADAVANFSPFNDILIAKGGGTGGYTSTATVNDGKDGGSSGGGASLGNSDTFADDVSDAGRNTVGQGNVGANGIKVGTCHAGGGGGAVSRGKAGADPDLSPDGGDGLTSSITGKAVTYGGGGGGCGDFRSGQGGLGGGGIGAFIHVTDTGAFSSSTSPVNSAGTDGLGGGGGAGGFYNTTNSLRLIIGAQPGGSGVVIIRYPIASP